MTTGKRGEEAAADYLRSRGYEVIACNWRSGRTGELDIVALRKNTLVVVEVKTATRPSYGDPVCWVGERKQERIARLAEAFLAQYAGEYEAVRFDVITLDMRRRPPKIHHIEDAFRARG